MHSDRRAAPSARSPRTSCSVDEIGAPAADCSRAFGLPLGARASSPRAERALVRSPSSDPRPNIASRREGASGRAPAASTRAAQSA